MTLDELRRFAAAHTLGQPVDLVGAFRQLGYVQADPIRAPARAQDLILRHRVADYRVDDLERKYPKHPLIEDTIYNYGFFHREVRSLLHPRIRSPRWQEFMDNHQPLRRKVLRYFNEYEEAHPRDIEDYCGAGVRGNGWGGRSSATTLMLEGLHVEGRLHVCRRDSGIKVYALATPAEQKRPAQERADALILLIANLYAPIPQKSLLPLVRGMGKYRPGADYLKRFEGLVKRGLLQRETVDGLVYVWPSDVNAKRAVADEVRLLAPFDPVVWDRTRFEHLWGWEYRFEAYTPAPARRLGYYALPLLWREQVIGWANASVHNARLRLEVGYAGRKPGGAEGVRFRVALEAERARFAQFLGVKPR
jgi:hypothetical protein